VKKILITGGAGFVGSSLAIQLKINYPFYEIICFDNLKRRGSELNLQRFKEFHITFVHGDIRNKEDFYSLPTNIDIIVEASAEPSVLAGLKNAPDYLINTNLIGTIHCLNFARKCNAGFIFLSTSRIYPIKHIESICFTEEETRFAIAPEQSLKGVSSKGIAEEFPIRGYRSLYGATKLASELLIEEYNQFYGVRSVINRCGVIAGPWQMGRVDQGVITLWLARHFWKQQLSYIGYGGSGKQVRDILHIDDLYRLIDYQIHNLERLSGEIFNAGGGNNISVSLKELTTICEQVTGNRIDIQKTEEDRAADIRIYITDNSKITSATGWFPEKTPYMIAKDIFDWLHQNENKIAHLFN
jgi:CDP-paratose 2-epimerase